MHLNYYTLRALAHEWNREWTGACIDDAYSQSRGELSLALRKGERTCTIHCRVTGRFRYLFRTEATRRARSNVAPLLGSTRDAQLASVEAAAYDRHIYFRFLDGRVLQFTLFGPRANVHLVGADGHVAESFRQSDRWAGGVPPSVVPALPLSDFQTFARQWDTRERSAALAFKRVVPLFDGLIVREVFRRTEIDPTAGSDLAPEALDRLWRKALDLERALDAPFPHLYAKEGTPLVFSLIALNEFEDWTADTFDSVDAALSSYVRRSLAAQALDDGIRPRMAALERELKRTSTSLVRMQQELASVGRADRYERWGHLLMANAHVVLSGADHAALPTFEDPESVESIPLDPSLSAIENAQQYYERARRSREARRHAIRRVANSQEGVDRLQEAIAALAGVSDKSALSAFDARYRHLLQEAGTDTGAEARLPFRRFQLGGGFEAWVGRNARQNDELTFRRAAKHDLWLHARGATGSHVIVRLPGRESRPPKYVIEQAARLAAHFSSASGSELVPVIVTRRKYVRKMKGGPPGTVVVDREDVLIVPPSLPKDTT